MNWIGFDLDGTLARNTDGPFLIGEPYPDAIDKLKEFLDKGEKVKIVTDRISHNYLIENGIRKEYVINYIRKWCLEHIGVELEVVSELDGMVLFYSNRCIIWKESRNYLVWSVFILILIIYWLI